ncbi:MAG: glutamine-hydrolyzing carbamoyl-phosphate synthase small subunit [Spirochaetaceae bacterium]|jgi:carbamoyl-phosphate synthase small subunit|nr:glutamine-hydrolyzing carbamoyl-phosphate synthase small subunit [Spirochaetaceae bacterium]
MEQRLLTARLVLEDGSAYSGWSFGKPISGTGEVVFTTGMTGYPQALTDPSFRGQILVSAYPLVGNYGVPLNKRTAAPVVDSQGIPVHFESHRVQAAGFVVAELCGEPSHYESTTDLSTWLAQNNVPGICGIDTRSLTLRLRERGVMRGKIVTQGSGDVAIDSGVIPNPVADVSPPGVRTYYPTPPKVQSGFYAPFSPQEAEHESLPLESMAARRECRVVLVDCGAKANILRCLLARGATVIRVPWNHDLTGIDYDGLFLSNGPGDPKTCGKTIALVRRAFTLGKPIFGICLGVQIMALAAGADTYKLPYGHRGQNQPCVEVGTRRCYITSQNHGYAVRPETLPKGWEVWFTNANDGTVEGIRSVTSPFRAVQFHPEGCPGPRDTEHLIDGFLDDAAAN